MTDQNNRNRLARLRDRNTEVNFADLPVRSKASGQERSAPLNKVLIRISFDELGLPPFGCRRSVVQPDAITRWFS